MVLSLGKRVSTLGAGRNCISQRRNSLEEGCYGIVFHSPINLLLLMFIYFFVSGSFCGVKETNCDSCDLNRGL